MTSAYTEKKSSGVDWLGEIPRHWNVSALKRVLSEPLKYGATEAGVCVDRSFPRYLRITDFDNDGRLRTDTFASLPEEIARDYYVNEGDVLFARSGATVGKTFLFRDFQGRACFAGYLIKASPARHKLTPEFLYYFTKSPAYEAWKDFIFTRATIQNIGADKYAYLPVCLPPLPEQSRIATYLDASCAAVDAAVAAKRRQLETLDELCSSILLHALTTGLRHKVETRSTGAAVLPQIPASWRFGRLKSVATIRYGLGQPPAELSSGVAMIRATDVDAGTIRTDKLLRVDPKELSPDRNPYLKAGEIIVVRSGAYTGDSAIVPPALEGTVAGYDMVVTVTRALSRFIAYCLLSRYVLEGQLLLLTLRAAQPHLNAEELGSVLLALPPTRTEQEDIADFLDTKLTDVRRIASGIKSQIATLTAYRKSLIHECVTGQRRITEADVLRSQLSENTGQLNREPSEKNGRLKTNRADDRQCYADFGKAIKGGGQVDPLLALKSATRRGD